MQVGFRDVGEWTLAATNGLIDYCVDASDSFLGARNALYAFCWNDEVMYIGKTTQSLRQRFAGYRNPGVGQQTNIRVHDRIKRLLEEGQHVRILVFAEPHQLEWGGVPINLPAGLEDGLIGRCNPPWNVNGADGGAAGRAKTESSELEAEALGGKEPEAREATDEEVVCEFMVTLGQAYFDGGYINPGVEASQQLGSDDSPITIYLGNYEERVDSFINRRANGNGSVRIIGSNRRIAEWFQAHFHRREVVHAAVLRSGNILLREPR